ncbi:MAG: hypothetical protein AAB368_05540, partial [bacterium]
LLALSLILYAFILRRLLALVARGALWVLPVAGAALLLLSAALHGFAASVLAPLIGTDPSIYRESMLLRSVSLAAMAASGLLAAASGWAYYRRMGD